MGKRASNPPPPPRKSPLGEFSHMVYVRFLEAERDQWRADCHTLLANLDWLIEVTGEAPEDEDAAMISDVRRRLEAFWRGRERFNDRAPPASQEG